MNIRLFYIVFLLLLVSCKTQEQIRQEQLVQNLNSVVQGQSQVSADTVSRISALEESIAKIRGLIENQNYKNQNNFNQRQEELEQRIKLLEESQQLTLNRLKKQDQYLKELLSSLKGKSAKRGPSTYQRAIINYQKKYYKSAKKYLLQLFENKKIKGKQRARVIHHLGMVEYQMKNNKKSLFYFSKLYTLYPKSSWNKDGLLHLARVFQRMNKKSEAVSTLNQLIKQFPGSKEAGIAKSMLQKL